MNKKILKHIMELNARLDQLNEFGWISNTKSLLKKLRADKIPVKRTSGKISHYAHPKSHDYPGGEISIGRDSPVFALHHEAGHHATNSIVRRYDKSQGDLRARWKLLAEREAHRAALKTVPPELIPKYKKKANKWYAGHVDAQLQKTTKWDQIEKMGKHLF
jgi:hypothetical protein